MTEQEVLSEIARVAEILHAKHGEYPEAIAIPPMLPCTVTAVVLRAPTSAIDFRNTGPLPEFREYTIKIHRIRSTDPELWGYNYPRGMLRPFNPQRLK